jgi:hypothetical protein
MISAKSQVIQIAGYSPQPGDKILVDSNILVWLSYNRVRKPIDYDPQLYLGFVKKAGDVGAQFWHCPIQLSELASTIEDEEWFHARHNEGLNETTLPRKEFRARTEARKNVVKLTRNSWSWISEEFAPNCAEMCLTAAEAVRALERFDHERMDTYDIFIAEAMSQNNIPCILTADRDFADSTGLIVLTGHKKLIDAARQEGRLLSAKSL